MDFPTAFDQSLAYGGDGKAERGFCVTRPVAAAGVAILEIGILLASSLLGATIFRAAAGGFVDLDTVLSLGVVAATLYLIVTWSCGHFAFSRLLAPDFVQLLVVCTITFLLLTANLFALKAGAEVSRGYVAAFFASSIVLLGLGRAGIGVVFRTAIATNVIASRPVVLVGFADEAEVYPQRDFLRGIGLHEVGRVIASNAVDPDLRRASELAAEAILLARVTRAREFVVLAPWSSPEAVARIEAGLRLSPLPVFLLPDRSVRALLARRGARETGVELLELQRAPIGRSAQVAKRAMDLLTASLSILVLLPLFALVALVIKWDTPGPVIFKQRRNGFDQRTFTIFKFRTMSVMEDDGTIPQARRDDSRVTRVGRLLRRTSIDELPQLMNVIRGDMSIVGPRPHALAHDQHYGSEIDDYCVRHHVKPGLTGWAQVNGWRGETRDREQMQRRVEHDLWYINNWSLLLDLRIMLRTGFALLSHDAY